MTNPFSLHNKTALVTGASRGLGRAIAGGLADAGARVILVARDAALLEEAVGEIGRGASSVACDVTRVEELEVAFSTLDALDIVVNNAGVNIPEPFLEVSPEHFDAIFDLNVRAAFFVAQAAARRMNDGGVIVNVSSQMGHVGAPNRTVYCASKHALEGFTKALAVELAPRGIRAVSVAPTFVETDMTRGMLEQPEFKASVLSSIPLGQVGQADDVVNAVVFLASSAARMVTGSSLKVDGGWTAR
jgi:NAD(P)-dependent dehydrogenase (short-subunit alcohol dehydrogenase family)